MKQVTYILIKVKSCSVLFSMLMIHICSDLKWVPNKNFFFIMDTCHPYILYFCEQGLWLFFEVKRGP